MQKTEIILEKPLTFLGKIQSNGRVVIPIEIRQLHDLHDGDYIELKIIRIIKRGGGENGGA